MFDDLRDAFREAVHNFRDELDRDDAPGSADRFFLGMARELGAARDLLAGLERQIEEARVLARRDADEEAVCRRRGELASRVGDEETARLALEYAVRHERRRVVLEKKIVALDEERQIRIVEIQEMTVQLESARSERDPGSGGGSEASEHERAPAMDDLEREFRELRVDPWAPSPRKEIDPDAALEALKRRMRESGS